MAELLIMQGGYMSNRCFNFRNWDLQFEIQTTYPLPEWKYARHRLGTGKITMSAVQLSRRIKKELDIDIFPFIKTLAIKGYADDGQVKFEMYGMKESEYYYFDCPRKFYNSKKHKLKLTTYHGDTIITMDWAVTPINTKTNGA